MGKFRLKIYQLISYDTLTDSEEFNEMVKNDPQAGTHITLKGAASLITQSKPKVKHRDYTAPVLILQPENDLMTPRYYMEKVFAELGSKFKKLVLVEGAPHFPINREAYFIWATEVEQFIQTVVENKNIKSEK